MLVSGVGQLNRPALPDIPGLERFRGSRFHSARWDHGVPLAGRRIGVIGNAASAIQFIPQIAPQAGRLSVFQRSANWMIPRLDRPYTARERRLFTRVPATARFLRYLTWAQLEARWPAFSKDSRVGRKLEATALEDMRRQVPDPALQAAGLRAYGLLEDTVRDLIRGEDLDVDLDDAVWLCWSAMQGLVVVPIFAGYDVRRKTGRLWKYDVTGGRYEEAEFETTGSGGLYAKDTLKKRTRASLPRTEALQAAVEALVDAADEDRATGGIDVARGIYPVVKVCTARGIEDVDEPAIAGAHRAVLDARAARSAS